MITILVVGVAVIDLVFQLDKFPDKPIKYRAKNAEIVGGGCAANAAVTISRLGGVARLASRFGDDRIAEIIIGDLVAEGVDCSLCLKFEGNKSSFSSVYVDASGERQLVNFRDEKLPSDLDWVDLDQLQVDAVLADTRWPEGARKAMEIAREKQVPGILDAEDRVMEAEAALALASHVAFSTNGLNAWNDGETTDDGVDNKLVRFGRRYGSWCCVTLGERGVRYVEREEVLSVPGFAVDAVDTLAAGDVWHGAFAFALARGDRPEHAVRFANGAAAIKCTKFGGRAGAPTADELERFLKDEK